MDDNLLSDGRTDGRIYGWTDGRWYEGTDGRTEGRAKGTVAEFPLICLFDELEINVILDVYFVTTR